MTKRQRRKSLANEEAVPLGWHPVIHPTEYGLIFLHERRKWNYQTPARPYMATGNFPLKIF
jgi:hypothetical protein